ncbi:MAG: hypothetical protein U0269_30245 [Polyangiales bacterium]
MNATITTLTSSRPTPPRREPIARARAAFALACALTVSLSSLAGCRCDSATIGVPAPPTTSAASVRNVNSVPPVVRDPSRIPGTYSFNAPANDRDAAR